MRVAADAERDHRRDLCAGSLPTSNRVMMVPVTVTEEAVSARLRSPSTASFPWSPEVKVTVGRDCIFHAQAYADAVQNAFGAAVRSDWTVWGSDMPATAVGSRSTWKSKGE